jgi:hypothetical protein
VTKDAPLLPDGSRLPMSATVTNRAIPLNLRSDPKRSP